MAWIQTIPEHDADGRLSELYSQAVDPSSGKVDNILKIHSLHPRGLKTHLELYKAVMTGTQTLPKVEREMIALIVSVLNRCHY